MDDVEREYDYKPKWRVIFLCAFFFGLGAVVLAFKAANNDRGLIISGIIKLGPQAATIFYLVLTACSLGFVGLAAFLAYHRVAYRQRLAFGTAALIVPASRWSGEEKEIAYRDIEGLSTTVVSGQRFLNIHHSGGKHTITASMMPSKAAFEEVCALLAARVREAQVAETGHGKPLHGLERQGDTAGLFRQSPDGTQSENLIDPEVPRQPPYDETPGGYLQWPPAPRRPVRKSRWKSCHGCGRLIPVSVDWVVPTVEVETAPEVATARRRTSDPNDPHPTVIEEVTQDAVQTRRPAGTWTYVCPFCGHCQVGSPDDSPDIRAQTACHECGTALGAAFQCPKCSFPRGWVTVPCPFCGNRQPVYAPHWVFHCDMFTLECVKCEAAFDSYCIC
jgi:hypothetical protein